MKESVTFDGKCTMYGKCLFWPDAYAHAIVDRDEFNGRVVTRVVNCEATCEQDATTHTPDVFGNNALTPVCAECEPLARRLAGDIRTLEGRVAYPSNYKARAATVAAEAQQGKLDALAGRIEAYEADHPDGIELAALKAHLGPSIGQSDITASLRLLGFAVKVVGPHKVRRWVR